MGVALSLVDSKATGTGCCHRSDSIVTCGSNVTHSGRFIWGVHKVTEECVCVCV